MTSDIERTVAPIVSCLDNEGYRSHFAREALDRLAGIAQQTGQVERVERLRLAVSRQIGGYASGDQEAARRALDVLIDLAEDVRRAQGMDGH